jgi:Na+-transporting NADH:ubiquinone oxidoreductase subunit A
MISVRISKGYDLPIQGAPLETLEKADQPLTVALLPEHIPFIRPRLAVKEGDRVAVGDVLFTDKSNPRLQFLSPGGGVVDALRYGPRRVLQEVVIRRDLDDEAEKSLASPLKPEAVDRCSHEDMVARLLEGGVWPFLRSLPYRGIADPESRPPAIIVGLGAREPFQVPASRYLEGRRDLLAMGLRVLKRLCPAVHVFADAGDQAFCQDYQDVITHAVQGSYPADDPGVFLFHVRRSAEENRAWFISGQDLLLVAQMLLTGRFPTERMFAVAGAGAANPRYVVSKLGAPLKYLAGKIHSARPRYTVGGVLTGFAGMPEGHAGLYETSIVALPEPVEADFLTLFRPGIDKPTRSRTFLSALRRRPLPMTTNVNGGRRACIACGYCADVCPVNIWPQMTYKSILAEEVEEALAHGLLDCVECGLCTYVCPSKIELAATLQAAKHAYRKEQA